VFAAAFGDLPSVDLAGKLDVGAARNETGYLVEMLCDAAPVGEEAVDRDESGEDREDAVVG
jgi:hypothetical protein